MPDRNRIYIQQDFVDQCTEVLSEFGAVRYSSFIRFIELNLGVTEQISKIVVERMTLRKDIVTSKYADTTVIKSSDMNKAAPKNLDAFDAYICLYEKAKMESEENDAYANKAAFPVDFVVYVTTGQIYNMFIYDSKNLAQKIAILDRKAGDTDRQITLIVFPVGTNLEKAAIPKINGKYRYAVVRKSKTGDKAVCMLTDIQEA